MAEFVYQIVDAFHIRGRGTVFCARKNDLAVPLQVGDTIELRGGDPPARTEIKAIEFLVTDGPPNNAFGFMVSSEISVVAMRRNPEVWRITSKKQTDANSD